MITYEKLWKRANKVGCSQYAMINELGISPGQIYRLRHNKGVSTHTLNTFCEILKCGLNDIAEYTKEDKSAPKSKKRSAKHK